MDNFCHNTEKLMVTVNRIRYDTTDRGITKKNRIDLDVLAIANKNRQCVSSDLTELNDVQSRRSSEKIGRQKAVNEEI